MSIEQVDDPVQETLDTLLACFRSGTQQQRIASNWYHRVDAAEQCDYEPRIRDRRRRAPARHRSAFAGLVYSLDQAHQQPGPARLATGQCQPEYQASGAAIGVSLPEQRAKAMQVEPVNVPSFQDCLDIRQQPLGGEAPYRIDQSLSTAKMVMQGRAGYAEIGRDMLDPHAVRPIFNQTPFRSFQNSKFCSLWRAPDAFRRSPGHERHPA